MFHDRRAAGTLLAERLQGLTKQQPVVLALPRGGVPVAAVIADRLQVPLGLLHVRKIGAPMQPELAVAAIADGETPHLAINHPLAEELNIGADYLREAAAVELKEIARRKRRYEGGHPSPDVSGRVVILVDDGIATGATVRAALLALRSGAPARIVLAVPVAPQSAIDQVMDLVDEVVCLEIPARFRAVGEFYASFAQVSDGEVEALMQDAMRRLPHGTAANSPAGKRQSSEQGSGGPGRT